MQSLTEELRSWIAAQAIDDCDITIADDGNVTLACEVATGYVHFYDINGHNIIEMRLERTSDGESMFFLHFDLTSIERAQQLFAEMATVVNRMLHRTVQHVMLCCTCGMTTSFFANKLNEEAANSGLDFDFCAMSVTDAKQKGSDYAAVLLAPQVGYERKNVVEALPDTLVMELPGRVFGSYDAATALRLLVDALAGARLAAVSDLRMARDFDHSKRVLAVSYVYRSDEPTLSYRVLDRGVETASGMLVRPSFDVWTLDDLAATLLLKGYPIQDFDAVGIAVPGVVDNGTITAQGSEETQRFDLAHIMQEHWDVPVYVDNCAVAAAAGCYVSQTEWDDVTFHAQPLGVVACDQGYVVGGHPLVGNAGFSGNLRYLAKDFSLSMSLEDAAWRYDGTRELVARYLAATICTLSPQAIFVWCDLVPSMEDLREELLKTLPQEFLPQLLPVADYDGLTLMGELALCLQRLAEDA